MAGAELAARAEGVDRALAELTADVERERLGGASAGASPRDPDAPARGGEVPFLALAEHSPDSMARFGRDLRCLYANPAMAREVGGGGPLFGREAGELAWGKSSAQYLEQITEVFRTGEEAAFELTWMTREGLERCLRVRIVPECGSAGEIASVLTIGRDISETADFRRRVFSLSFYDPMTGLANRTLFQDRLSEVVSDAARHGRMAGLIMIDLDQFRTINDALGHAAGDDLLREAGRRLVRALRGYDMVARLGGDEYAILLAELGRAEEAGVTAGKVLQAFTTPFRLRGRELFATASIGVALYPMDGTTSEQLLRFAEAAMYEAKARGRNNFQLYRPELTARAEARLQVEGCLRKALERNEFSLHYQPLVVIDSGVTVGAEALLRWNSPELGELLPDKFIGVAEETGLIVDIGEWVIQEASRAAADWNRAGRSLRVAVNLSTRQFRRAGLLKALQSSVARAGCKPEWLTLEITEGLLLKEDLEVTDTMTKLRDSGFQFAIDDFGNGYSALGYLRRFPIDTIKMDRSFIKDVATDPGAAALLRVIIAMARAFHMTLVAEGVETNEQRDLLLRWGAGGQLAQGQLFGHPMARAEFERMWPAASADTSGTVDEAAGSGKGDIGADHP